MTEPASDRPGAGPPGGPAPAGSQPSGQEHAAGTSSSPTARTDPERGLRGVMSAVLVLEAIVVLLGLTVIGKTGDGAGALAVTLVCALAAAHVAACVVIRRRFAVPLILVLQALLIACWVITASLGIVGIVFAIVWAIVLMMRREFRRRLADGRIPGQEPRGDRPRQSG